MIVRSSPRPRVRPRDRREGKVGFQSDVYSTQERQEERNHVSALIPVHRFNLSTVLLSVKEKMLNQEHSVLLPLNLFRRLPFVLQPLQRQ